jgi:hypothetical protein
LTESNEPVEKEVPEEAEDETLKKKEKRKKARLRTRGPYRKASTKSLPDASSNISR